MKISQTTFKAEVHLVDSGFLSPVDLDLRHWQNTGDTVVAKLNMPKKTQDVIALLECMQKDRPNEFDTIKIGGQYIIRLWWD